MSRDELQTSLRAKLEAAIRDRRQTEGEKAECVRGYNDALKAIDQRIDEIITELDDCQPPLPFGPQDGQ